MLHLFYNTKDMLLLLNGTLDCIKLSYALNTHRSE